MDPRHRDSRYHKGYSAITDPRNTNTFLNHVVRSCTRTASQIMCIVSWRLRTTTATISCLDGFGNRCSTLSRICSPLTSETRVTCYEHGAVLVSEKSLNSVMSLTIICGKLEVFVLDNRNSKFEGHSSSQPIAGYYCNSNFLHHW